MKDLPKIYESKKVEKRIYKLWEKFGYFNPDKLPLKKGAKSFCIMMPPPNITGSLHMGHALNNTIQDILIRFKRMNGLKTLWIPGVDHAGIATQNVVEKELKKEGLSRFDIGREKFIERVWQWYKKYGNLILEQLKILGASCDWSRKRFTMDKQYAKAVQKAFIHYYNKGLIYRGVRVVNWCTRCQTSLSDLELEYKEEKSQLWYIRYPFSLSQKEAAFIVVATTRPETMLGDAAVAVNPKDEKYKNLIGQKVILPIKNREIPIISDIAIDPSFGTGAVKITPAHDFVDYEISLRHNLPIYKIINENGVMTAEAGKEYENLNILEAREKIVAKLQELNLIEKIEDYTHNVAKCYRCGTTIEPLPNSQWFVKMNELAQKAIKEVRNKNIKFVPEKWEKLYFDWLEKIQDWCISRQIWWGHQLPVWFCTKNKTEINNYQLPTLKNEENYFVVAEKKPKKCPICKTCEMEQSTDVLDTWFSSALWPFATLGWPNACVQNQKSKNKKQNYCKPQKNSDLATYYPTQILSTDRGIINLWVARMIYSGIEFMGKKPFDKIYIHATVLNKEGKRMSKSLGTGVDPLELIEKYGSDATRFGIIYQSMENQDMKFTEEHLVAGKKFCNKIWNASRFVLNQISKLKIKNQKLKLQLKNKNLTKDDKKILNDIKKVKKEIADDIENFKFGHALHKAYDFFWHNFCDIYIEKSKVQIINPKTALNTQKILIFALTESLKMLHPFIPFITEQIYQILPVKNKKALIIENWN